MYLWKKIIGFKHILSVQELHLGIPLILISGKNINIK